MTRQSLRTVTLDTVANAAKAAERTVVAYRAGGHRLVAAMQQRVAAPTVERTQAYAPRLAAALGQGSTRAGGLADKGIDLLSDRTEQAIGAASQRVSAQVRRAAQLADSVDNRLLVSGLDAAARITLPGVQVARTLTARWVEGAEQLARTAAGPQAPRKAKAKVTTKTPAPARRAAGAAAGAKSVSAPAEARKPARRATTAARSTQRAATETTSQPTVKAAKVAKGPKAVKTAQASQPRAPRRAAPTAPVVSPAAGEAASA